MSIKKVLGFFIINFCWRHLRIADAACEYPSDLRGTWYSTSNGILIFGNDSISNLKNNADNTAHTYSCETVYNSKYISKASVDVFTNQKFHIYLCMSFTRISETKYSFTYETDMEPTVGDRLVAIVTTGSSHSVSPDKVCNMTNPLPAGTQELLIKNDSVSENTISCPLDLQSVFDVTLQNTSWCEQSILYGNTNQSKLVYNYSACADTDITFSDGGIFTCVYYRTIGGTTFLTVMNDDMVIDEVTYYRFLCYEYIVSNQIIYATYHPRICQVNQTTTYVASPGVTAVLTDRYPNTISTTSELSVGTVVGIALACLSFFALVFGLIYLKVRVREKVKASRIEHTVDADNKRHAWQGGTTYQKTFDRTTLPTLKEEENVQSKKMGKRREKKKPKLIQRKPDNLNDKRRKSVHWESTLFRSEIKDNYIIPEWQQKWESRPESSRCSEDGSLSLERSRTSVSLSSTSKVWILPESKEQTEVNNVWNKVTQMWEAITKKVK